MLLHWTDMSSVTILLCINYQQMTCLQPSGYKARYLRKNSRVWTSCRCWNHMHRNKLGWEDSNISWLLTIWFATTDINVIHNLPYALLHLMFSEFFSAQVKGWRYSFTYGWCSRWNCPQTPLLYRPWYNSVVQHNFIHISIFLPWKKLDKVKQNTVL